MTWHSVLMLNTLLRISACVLPTLTLRSDPIDRNPGSFANTTEKKVPGATVHARPLQAIRAA